MEKNNKILNKILKVILTILGLGVVLIIGIAIGTYLINDSDNDNTENNVNVSDEHDKSFGLDPEPLKQSFLITYDYYYSPNAYCNSLYGDTNDELDISVSRLDGDDKNPNGYRVSEQFASYDEMINFLKQHMSLEIINSKSTIKKDYYVEKDGNLYCADLGKGGGYEYGDISIEDVEHSSDKVEWLVTMPLIVSEEITEENKINVVYEKIDGRWIITSFEPVE